MTAPSPAAGVVVLDGSRARRIWFLIGSLLLVLASIVVIASSDSAIWAGLGVLLFAVAVLLFVVQMVRPDRLTLTQHQLAYTSLGRRTTIAWSEVAEFGILQLPVRGGTVKQVGIRMKAKTSQLKRQLVSGSSGASDAALPGTYGLSVEALIALLEEWRQAA